MLRCNESRGGANLGQAAELNKVCQKLLASSWNSTQSVGDRCQVTTDVTDFLLSPRTVSPADSPPQVQVIILIIPTQT